MTFGEKLDFLMHITRTTNSTLAAHTSLDASYISRLRRGGRTPVRNAGYLEKMSAYFASCCGGEHQKAALRGVFPDGFAIPSSCEKLAQLIGVWLVDEKSEEAISLEEFLNDLSYFSARKTAYLATESSSVGSAAVRPSVFIGNEGKRQAVMSFMNIVLSQQSPGTILLASDEDAKWMSESQDFLTRWLSLLILSVHRGNRIKIIHTAGRDLFETLSSIRKWLPLYMTGSIEPYYYPKARDGIFRRTLFVAPGAAAMFASSVGTHTEHTANFLTADGSTVQALTMEYQNYFALCRPLMNIFSHKTVTEYLQALEHFEAARGDTILKSDSLSIATMPYAVARRIIERSGKREPLESVLDYHRARVQNFQKKLQTQQFHEIIRVPNPKMIRNQGVFVSFSDLLDAPGLYYTAEEFLLHLQNVLYYLENYENYFAYPQFDAKPDGYMLYAKEDSGVIVAKSQPPSVVFTTEEEHMTTAFWDYLCVKANKGNLPIKVAKRDAILRLNAFLKEMR